MNEKRLSINEYFQKPIKYFNYQQSIFDHSTTQQSVFKQNDSSIIVETEENKKKKPKTVFDNLYEKAKQRLKRLNSQREQSEEKQGQEYTFIPETNRKKNKHLQSNILERGQIWLQMRKKSQINIRQQEMLSQMKDCTFSPKLNQKACKYYQTKRQNKIKAKKQQQQNRKSRSKTPVVKKIMKSTKPVPLSQSISILKNNEQLKTPDKMDNKAENSIFRNVSFSIQAENSPSTKKKSNEQQILSHSKVISERKPIDLNYEQAKKLIKTKFLNFNI